MDSTKPKVTKRPRITDLTIETIEEYVKGIFAPQCKSIFRILKFMIWNIVKMLKTDRGLLDPPRLKICEDMYIFIFTINTNRDVEMQTFMKMFDKLDIFNGDFSVSFNPLHGVVISVSKVYGENLFDSDHKIKDGPICRDVVGFLDISDDISLYRSIIYDVIEVMWKKFPFAMNRCKKYADVKNGTLLVKLADVSGNVDVLALQNIKVDGAPVRVAVNGFTKEVKVYVKVKKTRKRKFNTLRLDEGGRGSPQKKKKTASKIKMIQL